MPIRERNQQASSPDRERERAETMALQMIHFVLADEERADAFFGTTGLAPDDLRASITDPAFLGGVVDYLLEREYLLVAFCEEHEIDPMIPMRIRRFLR